MSAYGRKRTLASPSLLRWFSRSDEMDRGFGCFSIAGLLSAEGGAALFAPAVEQGDNDDNGDDN